MSVADRITAAMVADGADLVLPLQTNATDHSGNSRATVAGSGVTFAAASDMPGGNAATFDDTTSALITCTGYQPTSAGGAFSLVCWVRLAATPSADSLLGGNPGTNSICLFFSASDTMSFESNTAGGLNTITGLTIPTTTPIGVCFRFDDATNAYSLLFDGVQVGSGTETDALGNYTDLIIGALNSAGANPLNGKLNCLGFWTRVITDSEAKSYVRIADEDLPNRKYIHQAGRVQ